MIMGALIYMGSDRVTPDEDDWFVRVSGMVENETEIHMEEFRGLNTSVFSVALEGTGEDGGKHDYRGTPLMELLEGQGLHGVADAVCIEGGQPAWNGAYLKGRRWATRRPRCTTRAQAVHSLQRVLRSCLVGGAQPGACAVDEPLISG